MPSVLEAPLRAVDVPGFGDELLDPFRQSIVDEQLKKPASTLCLVLKHDRLEDNAATAFARLDRPGTSTGEPPPLPLPCRQALLPGCFPCSWCFQ